MSDFVIAELLILFLLALPMLRVLVSAFAPFGALSGMPFLALLLWGLILTGYDASVMLLILGSFAFLCLLVESSRFISTLQGLNTAVYSATSRVLRLFLLVILSVLCWAVLAFQPQSPYFTENELSVQDLYISYQQSADCVGRIIQSDTVRRDYAIIIFRNKNPLRILHKVSEQQQALPSGSVHSASPWGGTLARFGAERHFKVVELDTGSTYSGLAGLVAIILRHQLSLQAEAPATKALHLKTLDVAVKRAVANLADDIILICDLDKLPIAKMQATTEKQIKAIFCIVPKGQLKNTDKSPVPIIPVEVSERDLAPYGDLRGDDMLAAVLLGTQPDYQRADRVALAKRIYDTIEILDSGKEKADESN